MRIISLGKMGESYNKALDKFGISKKSSQHATKLANNSYHPKESTSLMSDDHRIEAIGLHEKARQMHINHREIAVSAGDMKSYDYHKKKADHHYKALMKLNDKA